MNSKKCLKCGLVNFPTESVCERCKSPLDAGASVDWSHTFGGKYTELVPGKRIVHTDAFEAGPGVPEGTSMKVTIDFTEVAGGTRVDITQEGIPKGPMADGSPIGWGQSLDNLAALCEQELPF